MKREDQVAVVTGAARGIGKTICEELGKTGRKIVLLDLMPEVVEEAAKELRHNGVEAKAYVVNVADSAHVAKVIKQIMEDFGRIDILVNNAGITRDNLIMRLKDQDWKAVLDVNLTGTFNCTKAVTRPMMKAKGGRIINLASVVGIMGNPGQANYSASKAGVLGLTKSAAKELASRNITVNAVAPGYIKTDMTEKLSEDARKAFLSVIPLGRPGLAKDVAGAVKFLASENAEYITGQTINVDGGMVMS
ncbi:MAG: 3-oxoacyl-[acyl-carrier-protein] reductase [Lentisphaeria bacterium]